MTPQMRDIEFLKKLNLKHIFDYRDSDEVALMKNNPYEKIGAEYHNIPAYLNNRKLLQIKKASYVKKLFHKVTLDDVKGTYSHLQYGVQGYGGDTQKRRSSHLSALYRRKRQSGYGERAFVGHFGSGI